MDGGGLTWTSNVARWGRMVLGGVRTVARLRNGLRTLTREKGWRNILGVIIVMNVAIAEVKVCTVRASCGGEQKVRWEEEDGGLGALGRRGQLSGRYSLCPPSGTLGHNERRVSVTAFVFRLFCRLLPFPLPFVGPLRHIN
jgi:hypothetical protein